MEIRILQETELANAAGLSRYVFDNCVKYRMEFPQTIEFVEKYLTAENLMMLHKEAKLIVWGAFEQGQMVGVSGMQSDGMITMLYILPQCFRRGYGSSLLTTMQLYARESMGKEQVFLNATPAWTSMYFKKKGFTLVNPQQNMHVPFVTMSASCKQAQLFQKKHVPVMVIVGAIAGCFLLATIIGIAFMLWYI